MDVARRTPVLVGTFVALLVPLAGFGLLLGRPTWDVHWEHHPSHFWLVLAVSVLSALLAYATSVAASRRGDARVLLVSLVFLSASGFLGLHALATPGVLLDGPNLGFALATPVGLVLGSVFAAASSAELTGQGGVTAMRWARRGRTALVAVLAAWAALSVAGVPPLDRTSAPERADGVLVLLVVPGIVLYVVSAYRYLRLWRRRPALMLLAMLAAFVLLAESLVAIAYARNWQVSWWEWHALMLVAFGLVAWGAWLQWHEERFADLYLQETLSGSREMSVLFADLQGFTAYSEQHSPRDVTTMLNTYFDVAVPPVVRRFGGDIDRIIGDALMVTFNRRGDQPDHAVRAAGAALALQEATGRVAEVHPGWPRFRVGVNSGEVAVTVLGTRGGRTHTVIGDTVNVASRIEGKAPAGRVAIGPATKALLPGAVTESLGPLELKGRAELLETFLLVALESPASTPEPEPT